VITKITDGVRRGDRRVIALLNNWEVELVEKLLSQRNFGDVLGQRLLLQVKTKNVSGGF
jgi:hypothetical protein